MKGIILAAGKGTRLYPITVSTPKPLLPVYDKPMIYYPLDTLLMAGIDDILIIVPPGHEENFRAFFGDGSCLGISIKYKVQTVARGIADAFVVGRDFIGGDDVCLILGDNIFYGKAFQKLLSSVSLKKDSAICMGVYSEHPQNFGVIEFDADGKAVSIEEKPQKPKSDYIIPGLYFYSNNVCNIAADIKPSERGELEITSVNNEYLKSGKLDVLKLDNDVMWYDTGSAASILECANDINIMQNTNKQMIGCVEKTAYEKGFITKEQMHALALKIEQSEYGKYLLSL